jgi:uncharacterized membrane protein YhfC
MEQKSLVRISLPPLVWTCKKKKKIMVVLDVAYVDKAFLHVCVYIYRNTSVQYNAHIWLIINDVTDRQSYEMND